MLQPTPIIQNYVIGRFVIREQTNYNAVPATPPVKLTVTASQGSVTQSGDVA